MSNDDVRSAIQELVTRYRGHGLALEDFESQLEILLSRLALSGREQDRALRGIVNELEVIRFTRLPESQRQAVDETLERMGQVLAELP